LYCVCMHFSLWILSIISDSDCNMCLCKGMFAPNKLVRTLTRLYYRYKEQSHNHHGFQNRLQKWSHEYYVSFTHIESNIDIHNRLYIDETRPPFILYFIKNAICNPHSPYIMLHYKSEANICLNVFIIMHNKITLFIFPSNPQSSKDYCCY